MAEEEKEDGDFMKSFMSFMPMLMMFGLMSSMNFNKPDDSDNETDTSQALLSNDRPIYDALEGAIDNNPILNNEVGTESYWYTGLFSGDSLHIGY